MKIALAILAVTIAFNALSCSANVVYHHVTDATLELKEKFY